jgi:hypothetical protein
MVNAAPPTRSPTRKRTPKQTAKPTAKQTAKPPSPVSASSFPLKPGQLFIDKDKVVYAILKDDRFPTVPGYMLLKRFSPISNTLAVCDTSRLRFITPVGVSNLYFGDYDFKVIGNTLWAYAWHNNNYHQTLNFTFIQSTPLTCTINNFP